MGGDSRGTDTDAGTDTDTSTGTGDTTGRAGAAARDPLALFAVDAGSATPPFRQLHELVVAAISDGRLLPGTRLPTVRALAAHLSLAANTVAGAYRSLEATGVIEGRGRAGTFVRLGDDPVAAEARRIALDAAEALRDLGVDRERGIRLLTDAYDAASGTAPAA